MSSVRAKVGQLHRQGVPPNEIARRLDVATPTVRYHLTRLASTDASGQSSRSERPARPDDHGPPVTCIRTRDLVAQLLVDGLSRTAIAEQAGVTKGTVSYHARRLGVPVDERCARRYDWDAIQSFYDRGHTVRECQARFGFSRQTWAQAAGRGAIETRPRILPLNELLVADTYRSRHNIKLRLLASGVKAARCEPLALHHVNGDRDDHRLENLELLCGNCHSQTDTFSGRNRRSPTGG